MDEETGKMWGIIEASHDCMVIDRFTGGLRARPMVYFPERENGVVWFITAKDSGKVEEIEQNPEVCMSIQNGSDYASVTGDAAILQDVTKLEELWNPQIDAWFPDGPRGGRAVLLRLTPRMGEYWDTPGGIVANVKMLVASVRDVTPDLGENEKVRFDAS